VLVPAYNAARLLPNVLERLARVHPLAATIVIDDGSTDATGEVARAAGVRLLTHEVNKGKGAGLLTGFHAACADGADAVVTLDSDGQHKPEDLPRMMAALDGADLVVGARVRTGAMPAHRRFGNALSAGFLTWLAGTPLPDVQSGYRAHRRVVLDALGLGRARCPRARSSRRRSARPATASNRRSSSPPRATASPSRTCRSRPCTRARRATSTAARAAALHLAVRAPARRRRLVGAPAGAGAGDAWTS
jgi:glycosyltransferase involved in cell wall biosynthesis